MSTFSLYLWANISLFLLIHLFLLMLFIPFAFICTLHFRPCPCCCFCVASGVIFTLTSLFLHLPPCMLRENTRMEFCLSLENQLSTKPRITDICLILITSSHIQVCKSGLFPPPKCQGNNIHKRNCKVWK